MSDAFAMPLPVPLAEPDRWTRRWAAFAGACFVVMAITPTLWPGKWRLAWDFQTWHGGAEYALTAVLALACLFTAFVRRVSGWLFLVIALLATAFYDTDWLYSGSRGLDGIASNAYCLGIAGVAAGNHLRKGHERSKVPRWMAAVGGALVVVVTIRSAWRLLFGPVTSTAPVASLIGEAAAVLYGALGVATLAARRPSTRFISLCGRLFGLLYLGRALVLTFVIPDEKWYGQWSPAERIPDFVLRLPAYYLGCLVATGVGIAAWVGPRLRADPQS